MSRKSESEHLPRRVLLVEDETMVAMLMEAMLEDLGFTTASHASTLEEGIACARDGDYDLAILDINIIGGTSFPIAAIIARRGLPFMFCSGYGRLALPEIWTDRQCIAKPFSADQLERALHQLLLA
ncbi:response regulator [Pseudomonas cannabina]|uniref:Response regulator n=3 Tax=Pseudomonas syringae group TaxID=136849 RepID=A0A8T8C0Q1_PSEYM|nr:MULTISPECIES: response regulator [Pseudomonas syringae group]KPB77319.1 Response regulator [Pseudomonas syringae pv. maculicola]MBM0140443.1 response regulator [Pseudomonas cannabina pv. alisalensis]QHE97089.1 response regulator [Pseudomonas syringae pv. maculicola str. ES4326]QQN19832.1 response regulator [Pseudomonas cannabina pv. alisalensis]RMN82482.1 Response regulator [Pseudomonas cannabina pv. alisalensis]